MSSDVVERANAALQGTTEGPWETYCVARDGDRLGIDNASGEQVFVESYGLTYAVNPADARFIAASRTLVPELAAELKVTRAELALTRDGYQVRPMTETESNLMTQVLDLRRERAESKAEVERLRGALDRIASHATQWVPVRLAEAIEAVLRGDQ